MKHAILVILMIIIFWGCKKNTSDQIANTSNPDLEIKSSTDVKVTFIELGSVRCIPCKMMQPVMKKVEENFEGQVSVVFYDVWTEKDAPMAENYKIKVIPTQVFLDSKGEEYYRHEGYFPYEELEKVLNEKGVK